MPDVQLLEERPLSFPPGFSANAVIAGLKPSGAKDLALVAASAPVPCAGVFTRSMIKAAPVRYCQEVLRRGHARAVITNAGVANAATGKAGMEDTRATAEAVGMVLMCDPADVLVCSTGVIGRRLDMKRIRDHVAPLVNGLNQHAFDAVAAAIQTTDTKQKDVALTVQLGDTQGTIVGMAKGSGMIAPNMATLLAYLFTDVAVEPAALQVALTAAVRDSFNAISVDGDTSTNDTVLIFASGEAGNTPLTQDAPEFATFAEAVQIACDSLARQVVQDGEGVTKLIELYVDGAPTYAAARHIGLTVANSPLVKTAVFGEDPNYGRLIMAIGKAGVAVAEEDLNIRCGDIPLLRDGEVVEFDREAARAYLRNGEVAFYLHVGTGPGSARVLTCDLTYDYVRINAEYTT